MSNPRSIAQVTTAASGLSGAGVTMDVSNAGLFVTGQLVELYPSQYGDGAPLARAGQTVRFLISAIAGAQLTGEMNLDNYANPPQVEAGWIIDGRDTSGSGASTIRLVDDIAYPRTRAGIAAAVAVGPGKVYIPPGTDIDWDTTTVTYTGDDLWIESDPSVRLNLPATATNVTLFDIHGLGGGLSSAALTVNAAEGALLVVIGTAAVNAMVAAGLVQGSTLYFQQDLTDASDPNSDSFSGRTVSIDAPGGALYIDVPFPKPFTIARAASVGILRTAQNNRVSGLRIYGNGNTGTTSHGVLHYYTDSFHMDDCVGYDLPGSLRIGGDYHIDTTYVDCHAVRCGNASGLHSHEDVRGTGGNFSNISDTDCVWGQEYKGSVYCNADRLLSGFSTNRGIKVHHGLHNNFSNWSAVSSYTFSGLTVSGDSNWNNFVNGQAQGNFEAGLLLTQVPAGTNVVGYNQFANFTARFNNWGGAAADIFAAAPLSQHNRFRHYMVGSVVNTATDNFFDAHPLVSNITTAGAGTYTAAQLAGGRITRNPNGASRIDTTDTAANLIAGLALLSDGEERSCELINTAAAAESITLAGGASVTIVNAGQLVDQNQSALLRIRRTSSTTVSIYLLGA